MHWNTFHLRSRTRMYLLVTIACGISAGLMQLFLAGTDEFKNYAERRLEQTVRDAVATEVAEVSRQPR